MFYKKKYQIERANNAMRMQELGQLSKENAELRTECDDLKKKLSDMTDERNILFDEAERLTRENSTIKRELEEVKYKWGAENEALAADKEHRLKRIDNQARTIAELQKAKTRPECPPDCTKHANPGPGGSVCRSCIRNPHAVDKYKPKGDDPHV